MVYLPAAPVVQSYFGPDTVALSLCVDSRGPVFAPAARSLPETLGREVHIDENSHGWAIGASTSWTRQAA